MATTELAVDDTAAKMPPKLEIKVSGPWQEAYAGEWLPLVFDLQRSDDDGGVVRLENLESKDPDLLLDIDMLQHGILLRPGERYRFQVPVRVSHPKTVELSALDLTLSRLTDSPAPGPIVHQAASDLKLQFKPSLGQEFLIRAESLCRYEEGTKVLLTIKHQGGTRFHDLNIGLGPTELIRAGKPAIQRREFLPGDEERMELVVHGPELELIMTATVGQQRPELRRTLKIAPPRPPTDRRFRFLEPRRLARDQVRIVEVPEQGDLRAVRQHDAVYFLESGCQYQVAIQSMQPGVKAIHLQAAPPLFHVCKTECKDGAWQFTIDVTAHQLFRMSRRLFYEVEIQDGSRLTGEIPICLKQTTWRYWQVAAALGLATTVQGISALGRFLHHFDLSLFETVSEFRLDEHMQVLYLLSVPGAWAGLRFIDWFQYLVRR